MKNYDHSIQNLHAQFDQVETTEQMLALLPEIHMLIKEYPAKETYLLLEQSFRMLLNITSDTPEEAYTLITQQLLPWLFTPNLPESASIVQHDCYDLLQEWINQYPDPMRYNLLQSTLDRAVTALTIQPTQQICWIISTLGYRRRDVVAELWNVVREYNDELGDTALRTLAHLGVQEPARQQLLKEFHRRIATRVTLPLLGGLSSLADITTLPIITQCIRQLSSTTEEKLLLARILALGILADIADAYTTDSTIQRTIWETIISLYLSAPGLYANDICLNSQLTPRCNDPLVPQQFLQWLDDYPEDTERSRQTRYLFYLRFLECTRPQQLQGMSPFDLPASFHLLYQDAHQCVSLSSLLEEGAVGSSSILANLRLW